jgi:hypothetical protein
MVAGKFHLELSLGVGERMALERSASCTMARTRVRLGTGLLRRSGRTGWIFSSACHGSS